MVVSCRGTAEKVKPVTEPHRKVLLEKLFSSVAAIHCVSADMAATILPYCSQASTIFVNRPSIDPHVFQRATPYVPNQVCQILTIGRFTFQKGYLIGLLAVREVKKAGYKFTWSIVGDGPQQEEILYHIHALDLSDCVRLVGKKNRDEILDLYKGSDVFLLPSVYEGIANVCLEAMSMELPVVCTRSGGMEEVIEQGRNGVLCEVYDPASIVVGLRSVLDDRVHAIAMGKAARQTVLQQFTIERQINVFEQEYQKLLPPV